MWIPVTTIKTPLTGNSARVKTITVDPWQGNSQALAFPMAIDSLSMKLRLNDNDALLAVAISTTTLNNFATALASFNHAFTTPFTERLLRRTLNHANLQTSKFQLVSPMMFSTDFDVNSLDRLREAHRNQVISNSKNWTSSFKNSDQLGNLINFSQQKAQRDQSYANQPSPDPSIDILPGCVWAFFESSDIMSSLKKNMPDHNYQFTAITAFIAPQSDLSDLAGLFL